MKKKKPRTNMENNKRKSISSPTTRTRFLIVYFLETTETFFTTIELYRFFVNYPNIRNIMYNIFYVIYCILFYHFR